MPPEKFQKNQKGKKLNAQYQQKWGSLWQYEYNKHTYMHAIMKTILQDSSLLRCYI